MRQNQWDKSGTILLLMLVAWLFSPYHALMFSSVKGDDASYLAHAFTIGLQGNFSYPHGLADWVGPSGVVPSHPIGPGVLAAPFVAFFSWFDSPSLAQNPITIQYSWALFGFVLSSLFYFLLGIALYHDAFKKRAIKVTGFEQVFFALGIGVGFYVFYRPLMAHAFEFFALALVVWASFQCLDPQPSSFWKQLGNACALVCALWLTLMIRPSHLNVIGLPILVGATLLLHSPSGYTVNVNIKAMLLALCVISPFFLGLNIHLYGTGFPSGAHMYGPGVAPIPAFESWADKKQAVMYLVTHFSDLFTIVFSSEFGILFSAPFLLFGTICFAVSLSLMSTHRVLKTFFLGVLGLYLALPVVIIIFWQSNGEAYGHRFLFVWYPVALLGYGAFKHMLISQIHRLLRTGLVVFTLFALASNALYGVKPQLKLHQGPNAFGADKASGLGYEWQVAKALVEPSTWVKWTMLRTPGFIGYGIFQGLNIPLPQWSAMPKEKWAQLNCCVTKPPWTIYLQVGLMGLMCLMFFGGILRKTSPKESFGKIPNAFEQENSS